MGGRSGVGGAWGDGLSLLSGVVFGCRSVYANSLSL